MKTVPINMKKNAIYLIVGFGIAMNLFFYFMENGSSPSGLVGMDKVGKSPLPTKSASESKIVGDIPSPAEFKVGGDGENANQKKLEEGAKHESEYKAWMKSIGRENEGRTSLSFDTHGIAGGLQQYYDLFQSYPGGGNREIAKALFGNNPRKVRILNWPKRKLSVEGEFLDPWGTPYQIQVIRQKIEIRSAGPNRLFWDADDQFIK